MSEYDKRLTAILIGLVLSFVLIANRKVIKQYLMESVEGLQDVVWDALSEQRIERLHPAIRSKARAFLNKAAQQGIKLRITAGLRSYAEQNALYAKGRTTSGKIVTNAKGGQSNHNFGLAIDVVPIKNGRADWDGPWEQIGAIGKSVGFAWGGEWTSFVDRPHFEMLFGLSTAALRERYESGNTVNDYVRLA